MMKFYKRIYGHLLISMLPCLAWGATSSKSIQADFCSLPAQQVAHALDWVDDHQTICGGYYIDPAISYPLHTNKKQTVEITSKKGLISQKSTSILEGQVMLMRYGQQITTNKAYIYRNKKTWKLESVEMFGDIHFREPNTLILAKHGKYEFATQAKYLDDILYRTAIGTNKKIIGPRVLHADKKHKIESLSAWGKAKSFMQKIPRTYILDQASYTTCPPNITPAWQLKSSHLDLNKNTGRGEAHHARLLVKGVPVLYTPYLNFPIDQRRKSGILWPTFGVASNQWGPYFRLPIYWNMAENYDYTFTPALLSKRGVQLGNKFRYLSESSAGELNFAILPNDRFFNDFQNSAAANPVFTQSSNSNTQANLNRLLSSSSTRKGLNWAHRTRFDSRWTGQIDFNYAGDDYYQRDFGNLDEATDNQLLQQAILAYHGPHWNFITRLQSYQTLHPLYTNNQVFENQYRRLPQLVLDGNYPNQLFGADFYIHNEATHFEILKTPGNTQLKPIGERYHTQPSLTLPFSRSYFYATPRLQLPLTEYSLRQTTDTQTPSILRRAIPIFDIATGAALSRESSISSFHYRQTIEPQIYYTYIPYRKQSQIPVFDTTNNTLSYDQLFNYNRFSGIDRIGDANQMSWGIVSRIIDQESGYEKARLGLGQVIYFSNRLVTLCQGPSCNDLNPDSSNRQRLSPISAVLDYHINRNWSFNADPVIWDPTTKQLNNVSVAFQYRPETRKLLNIKYSFVHGGDSASGITSSGASNNLKVTDVSLAWPLTEQVSAVGRWSQNWNRVLLQNLLYGLQYDTCCWAVRMVGGRTFLGLDSSNSNQPDYKNEFYIQFSLKGLGDIGSGDPTALLDNITGYNNRFGQDF